MMCAESYAIYTMTLLNNQEEQTHEFYDRAIR